MLTYGNKSFTWSSGRNLAQITDGDNTYSYTYDENGIRTSKTLNGVTTYYNTRDGIILSQTDGENTWYFQYDTSGTPLGFVLNGTQYFYITNQMNDVLAITDTNGDIVGNYEYDAWGKVLTADTDLAKQNPLRYRGYYYDNEMGYYYLQSRYYDSNICRFINADSIDISKISKGTVFGNNIFAYCDNDAVNDADYNGFYSAYRAKLYANRWWDSRNTSKYWTNDYDCANFVSQCLYAGDLSSMTGIWNLGWHHYKFFKYHKISKAWGTADGLFNWLKKNHSSGVYSFTKNSALNSFLRRIYYNYTYCSYAIFFDWENDGFIDHAALSGEITKERSSYNMYYFAHSSNRAGRKRYYNYEKRKYILYHLAKALSDNRYCKIYLIKLK